MSIKWICDKQNSLARYPVLEVIEKTCHSFDYKKQNRFITMKTGDWCNIIPITSDGKVVMVKQFRIGIEDFTLELPGGIIEAEEDFQAAALRELEEETGFVPLNQAKCVNLGWSHPNPALMNNRCHYLVVGPVEKKSIQNLDPGEMIEVLEVPIEEIPEKLSNGQISHALMLNNFFMILLRLGSQEEASRILLRGLRQFATS